MLHMLNEPLRRIPGMDPNEPIDPLYTLDQLDQFGWLHGLPQSISLRRTIENIDNYPPNRPRPPSHYVCQRRVWRKSVLLRILDGEWTNRHGKKGRPLKNGAGYKPLAEQDEHQPPFVAE